MHATSGDGHFGRRGSLSGRSGVGGRGGLRTGSTCGDSSQGGELPPPPPPLGRSTGAAAALPPARPPQRPPDPRHVGFRQQPLRGPGPQQPLQGRAAGLRRRRAGGRAVALLSRVCRAASLVPVRVCEVCGARVQTLYLEVVCVTRRFCPAPSPSLSTPCPKPPPLPADLSGPSKGVGGLARALPLPPPSRSLAVSCCGGGGKVVPLPLVSPTRDGLLGGLAASPSPVFTKEGCRGGWRLQAIEADASSEGDTRCQALHPTAASGGWCL